MSKNNKLLWQGILLIVFGLVLFGYSLNTYYLSSQLNNKIDFDSLDNNNQISTSDKYVRYLAIGDYLYQELKKHKDLPLKNASCIYLEYAQHNAISLYRLIFTGVRDDGSRRDTVNNSVQALYDMLDNYKSCKNATQYKAELKKILKDIEHSQDLYLDSEMRMDAFLNTKGFIEPPQQEVDTNQQAETTEQMDDTIEEVY